MFFIGNYVQFGPNVEVLSSNHDLFDQRKSNSEKIVIEIIVGLV